MNRSVEEMLTMLHHLSGMSISLYDASFHGIPCGIHQGYTPTLCSCLQQADAGARDRCFSSDVAAKQACDGSGRAYGFFCPFGLYEILVPIRDGASTVGYLFLGKSLPAGEAAEARLREILGAIPALDAHPRQIDQWIASLPRHTQKEYDAIGKTAEMVARRIAENGFMDRESVSLARLTHRFLRTHYGERITLSSLGLYFHCSTVTLTESFRKEYGKTIMEELAAIRMTRACELLSTTDAPVGAIAGRCGYPDMGYFTKRFHKCFGCSPSDWRRLRRDGVPSSL